MTRPAASAAGAGQLFSAQMGKWITAIASSMCWAIFSRYCGQRTMSIKGAKRNVPHLLQAQKAPALSPSQLFPTGYAGV